jgi:integrase/recombinase XerC
MSIAPARSTAPARIPAAWAAMIDDYCSTLDAAGQSAPTIRLRRQSLSQMARGLAMPPEAVTGDHLVKWFGGQRWKSERRRCIRSAARGFFSWAYRAGRLPNYFGDDLPPVRTTTPLPRPVPDNVWRQGLAAANLRVTVMLRLAAEAGLRRAEVAQVRTHDVIDGASGPQLLIHGKGDKKRLVPITESLAAVLRQGAAGHTPGMPATGWLFPNGLGNHIAPGQVGRIVTRALPDEWSMHKLRHRFATRAYRGSRNLRAVQPLLGHTSVATTQRYTAVMTMRSVRR